MKDKKRISNQKNKTTSFKDFLGGKKRSYRRGSIHFFGTTMPLLTQEQENRQEVQGQKKKDLKDKKSTHVGETGVSRSKKINIHSNPPPKKAKKLPFLIKSIPFYGKKCLGTVTFSFPSHDSVHFRPCRRRGQGEEEEDGDECEKLSHVDAVADQGARTNAREKGAPFIYTLLKGGGARARPVWEWSKILLIFFFGLLNY